MASPKLNWMTFKSWARSHAVIGDNPQKALCGQMRWGDRWEENNEKKGKCKKCVKLSNHHNTEGI